MSREEVHVITGAFGYSGRHIATRLLAAGHRVRTLTGHPDRPDPFDGQVEVRRFDFDHPAAMREALAGATVLYNTYWVRFAHGRTSHGLAVERSEALFRAAAEAGVERVVHTSITRPSADSPLPYFSGKARVEAALAASGLSHAILRPAVFFGGRDVLINNIAWLLRRLPVFGLAGKGDYGIQPIHVEDFAALAVEHGRARDNVVLDAVGPERFEFGELVRLVKRAIGSRSWVVGMPPAIVLAAAKLMGWLVKDVVLTGDEVRGLMAGLLVSNDPPTGKTRFTDWLAEHADALGRSYANELARHFA